MSVLKHRYRNYFLITSIIMTLAAVLGAIIRPESNLQRYGLAETFYSVMIIVILLCITYVILQAYTALTQKIFNIRSSFRQTEDLILFGFGLLLVATFAVIIYKPSVDDGFAILLLPMALLQAIWTVPLIQLIIKLIIR